MWSIVFDSAVVCSLTVAVSMTSLVNVVLSISGFSVMNVIEVVIDDDSATDDLVAVLVPVKSVWSDVALSSIAVVSPSTKVVVEVNSVNFSITVVFKELTLAISDVLPRVVPIVPVVSVLIEPVGLFVAIVSVVSDVVTFCASVEYFPSTVVVASVVCDVATIQVLVDPFVTPSDRSSALKPKITYLKLEC